MEIVDNMLSLLIVLFTLTLTGLFCTVLELLRTATELKGTRAELKTSKLNLKRSLDLISVLENRKDTEVRKLLDILGDKDDE